MASKKPIHTTPKSGGKGWVNTAGGRTVSAHRTQETAAERGREIAKKNEIEHVIHRPDGRIREKNSYGNDPHPPKG